MFIFIIPEKSIPEPKQDHYRIRNTFWIIKALQKLENWVLTPPDYDAPLKPDRLGRLLTWTLARLMVNGNE